MKGIYRGVIAMMMLLGLALLASSVALMDATIGFTPQSLYDYYAGALPKSDTTLLKTAWRHIASIAVLVMVVLHFVLFLPRSWHRWARLSGVALFVLALLMVVAPLGVTQGGIVWAWVKLGSNMLFLVGMATWMVIVLRGSLISK